MKITSSAFENEELIPEKYTCDGENINPPLSISELPKNTKSLVLIFDDPDLPNGTWIHWTLWDIPVETKEIAENSIPNSAIEGINSFGNQGYSGPCPGSGTHRYFFNLYALNEEITFNPEMTGAEIAEKINLSIIQKAELVGKYERKEN